MDEHQIKELIVQEVQRQLSPISSQLAVVAAAVESNNHQTSGILVSMSDQTVKVEKMLDWAHKFWGNGSGRPGYYDIRSQKEDERFDELVKFRDQMLLENARREGAELAAQQLAVKGQESSKTKRDWWLIFATAGPVVLIELVKMFWHH